MRVEERGPKQIIKDEQLYKAEKDYEDFRDAAYQSLPPNEKIAVNKAAVELRSMLQERSRMIQFSLDNAIEVVMTTLYFRRFGETPIETRMKSY